MGEAREKRETKTKENCVSVYRDLLAIHVQAVGELGQVVSPVSLGKGPTSELPEKSFIYRI